MFLEDVASRGLGRFSASSENGSLRALCHIGANVVPSGVGCAAFGRAAASSRARMVIGEERAVADLWDAAAHRMPTPREDRPGQPVYVLEEPPEPGETGLREATLADLGVLVPACAAAHEEEIGINPLDRDRDGFRWRTQAQIGEGRSWVWMERRDDPLQGEASAWTPDAVQLQQVWVDPAAGGTITPSAGCATSAGGCSRSSRGCVFLSGPENAPAIRVYEAIGMQRTISYRSLIF